MKKYIKKTLQSNSTKFEPEEFFFDRYDLRFLQEFAFPYKNLMLNFGTETLVKNGTMLFNAKLKMQMFLGKNYLMCGQNFGFRSGYF